jgi:hypothetical protein
MFLRVITPFVIASVCLFTMHAEAKCPVSESNPNQELNFDKWQSLMPDVDSVLEGAIGRLVKEKVSSAAIVHRALSVNNRSVASWFSCDKKNCRGGVLYMNSNPARLRIIRRALLPHNERVGNQSGKAFRVLHTLIEDVDNDGDTELVVRYEVDGPRRPTTGIQTYEYMAIYNLPDLKMQLFFRLGQHGGEDFQEFCSYAVVRKDFNCDRRTDLLIKQECGMNICFEEDAPQPDCKGQPKEKKWHLFWQKEKDIYAGKRGYAQVTPVKDDRPYLVVAGQFAVASDGYLDRAKALKKKLVKAGYVDTMIHNSREFASLSCCYRTVVVDRFTTKEATVALRGELKKKGFKTYVRKGF